MTRHARNCTAGAVYTYNEKRKDAAQSGYGINAQRISKDSVKSFDCCSLSLQPCRNPVITRDGYLFDKEAILQYIVSKKNDYSLRLKEYEKFKAMEGRNAFKANQFPYNIKLTSTSVTSSNHSSISNMANGNESILPSFWVPTEGPNVNNLQLERPDPTIYGPISQKPLRIKDLIDIKFTPLKDGDSKKSLIVKEARYMCPITHDVLSNAVPCAVLTPTYVMIYIIFKLIF